MMHGPEKSDPSIVAATDGQSRDAGGGAGGDKGGG